METDNFIELAPSASLAASECAGECGALEPRDVVLGERFR